ncbi:MAG: alanine racemase [Parvularculales bacterium]
MTINLSALIDNWRICAAQAPNVQTAAVIKADAYGLGLTSVTPSLVKVGCECFFVALVEEGKQVRYLAPDSAIYVMNGLFPGLSDTLTHYNLRPCLGSLEEIHEWVNFCRMRDIRPPVALHIDSGMNRLGLSSYDVRTLAGDHDLLNALNITLIMSHLACASMPSHPMNEKQLRCFNELRALLPTAPASLANTAGIWLGPPYHFDVIRPGIGLYGGNPNPERPSPFKTVVTLEAPIIKIRTISAGESVGYDANYTAQSDRRIAIISTGYADGYPYALGAGHSPATARAADIDVPIIGRISMDMLALDITDTPPDSLKRGDCVELFGNQISLERLATAAKTTSYEILTRIGKRYDHCYI